MGKRGWIIAGGLLTALITYNAWVAVPVIVARSGESGVTAVAYRRWLIDPTTIVFDLWSLDGERSMADVDRNLFKSAEALKDRSYSGVVLAYRGRGKLMIDGDHFQSIGEQRSYQNPIRLIGDLPEHTFNLDGTPAFSSWSGGFIGVMLHQMTDHNELHERWYMRSMAGLDDAPTAEQGR
jgi:hypothetical protein